MFRVVFLESVNKFIEKITPVDKAKILSATTIIVIGNLQSLHIKTLRGPIRELIIKQYRLIFFFKNQTFYFVGAFIKKSRKTPIKEINQAQVIYKQIV